MDEICIFPEFNFLSTQFGSIWKGLHHGCRVNHAQKYDPSQKQVKTLQNRICKPNLGLITKIKQFGCVFDVQTQWMVIFQKVVFLAKNGRFRQFSCFRPIKTYNAFPKQ